MRPRPSMSIGRCLALAITLLSFIVPLVRADGEWSAPLSLSPEAVAVEEAVVALDSVGRVHVVWSEAGAIQHRFRTGHEWSVSQQIATGNSLSLAADGRGRVYLAFSDRPMDQDHDHVYLATWQSGLGWNLPVNISAGVPYHAHSPHVTVAPDGTIALVWVVEIGGDGVIYVARSADGSHWTITPLPHAQGAQPVATYDASGTLYVAWVDLFAEGFAQEILVSRDAGRGWSLPLMVSASPLIASTAPTIAALGDRPILAWQEATPEGSAIYTAELLSDGWSAPAKRSGVDVAYLPTLIVDPFGRAHVLWATSDTVRHRSWDLTTGVEGMIETVAARQKLVGHPSMVAGPALHAVWPAEPGDRRRQAWYSARATIPASQPRAFLPWITSP